MTVRMPEECAAVSYAGPAAAGAWYGVAWVDEIGEGELRAVCVDGHELVAYRGGSGTVHAVDGTDPRRGFPLLEGQVVDDGVRSLIDGWTWTPDGTATDEQGVVRDEAPALRSHPAHVLGGLVVVRLGGAGESGAPAVPAEAAPLTWDEEPSVDPVRTRSLTGDPLVALENLADAPTLGFLLRAADVTGPEVDAAPGGLLHLRFGVRYAGALRTVEVRADGPYLMTVAEPDGGGAMLAVTPRAGSAVELRAALWPPADDRTPFDWARLVREQAALVETIDRAAGHERGLAAIRDWARAWERSGPPAAGGERDG